jgi:DNA-directed RNA polymerase subunit RPC12/RpoP
MTDTHPETSPRAGAGTETPAASEVEPMIICPKCGEHFNPLAHRTPGEHGDLARCPHCGAEFSPDTPSI